MSAPILLWDMNVLEAAADVAIDHPDLIPRLLAANGRDILDVGESSRYFTLLKELANAHARGERPDREVLASRIAEASGATREDIRTMLEAMHARSNPAAFPLFEARLQELRFRRRLATAGEHAQNGHGFTDLIHEVQAVAAIGATPGRELAPLTSADLVAAARASVQWAIKPLHTVKGIRITGAPGKTMKTTWTIAEMVRAIHGGTLAGQFDVASGHTVAWFDAENSPASWSRKFLAVCGGLEVDAQDIIDSGRFCYFNSRGLYLDDDSTLQSVIDAARKVNASQVVLDSLTRIHRLKENDAGAMSSFFIDRIFRLRDEAKAGITILHHTRKGLQGFRDNQDDALRGTGDLRNVVDSYISMTRSRKDKNVFTLTVSAQRDAAEEGPFHWRLDWTDDSGARFDKADPDEVEADSREPLPPHRPPRATETARRVIQDALGVNPNLRFTEALQRCKEASVGKTVAKQVWREIHGE